jgi:HK97 family phage portal protein
MRVKSQIEEQFMGIDNAGKPILLEGGLDWKEMSLSPKDMDFIEAKHTAAREIALAFGVPPQLLGIPGDNTYSNLAESRLALWEKTIIPLIEELVMSLQKWLIPHFKKSDILKLSYDVNNIPALLPRREKLWDRVSKADFLSDEEKRKLVGLAE